MLVETSIYRVSQYTPFFYFNVRIDFLRRDESTSLQGGCPNCICLNSITP